MSGEILVVGKEDSILGFKSIGLKTLFWEENNSEETFRQLIDEGYKIIFITEDIYVKTTHILNLYKEQVYPIFIPIPTIEGSKGIGYQNVQELIVQALGTASFDD